jgi:hypothetical protein
MNAILYRVDFNSLLPRAFEAVQNCDCCTWTAARQVILVIGGVLLDLLHAVQDVFLILCQAFRYTFLDMPQLVIKLIGVVIIFLLWYTICQIKLSLLDLVFTSLVSMWFAAVIHSLVGVFLTLQNRNRLIRSVMILGEGLSQLYICRKSLDFVAEYVPQWCLDTFGPTKIRIAVFTLDYGFQYWHWRRVRISEGRENSTSLVSF